MSNNTGLRFIALLLASMLMIGSSALAQVEIITFIETHATLTWTAPGDDGNVGQASLYDIRYAPWPIDDSNWDNATEVSGEPSPRPSGQSEEFIVNDLPPNHVYCFALKTADEVLNWSPLSNIDTLILPPTLIESVLDLDEHRATLTCAAITSFIPLNYEIAIDDDSTFSSPVIQPGTVDGSEVLTQFEGVLPFQMYYWRCRALSQSESDTSRWSSVLQFKISSPPTAPTNYSPANGDTVIGTPVRLQLTNSVDADGDPLTYSFFVSPASDFSTIVASALNVSEGTDFTTTALSTFEPSANQQYWWRCRANDGGLSSEYSSPTWFEYLDLSAGGGDSTNERIFAAPNPVHRGETVTFHLPDERVDLLIMTVSGETVLVQNDLSGDWTWNLRNASGNELAVGIYLWYVNGAHASGKIIIKP